MDGPSRSLKGALERSKELYGFDETLRRTHRYIAGVDEVGRGPMAGPVVAAAVILPPHPIIPGIDDSKRLTPKKREHLFDVILESCVALGIGMRSSKFVDERGIAEATYSAMRMAVWSLSLKGFTPDLVLVDGYKVRGLSLPQESLVRGDSTSASVASASIVAKVVRDRIMERFETIYPGYGFNVHKGYCTATHRSIVQSLGPCPIHRKSFAPVLAKIQDTLFDFELDET